MQKLIWNRKSTPQELNLLLEILGQEYSISESGKGITLEFRKREKGLDVKLEKNRAIIEYSSVTTAARGVGTLLSGSLKPGSSLSEEPQFKSIGIMLDVSRNAVMNVEHFKKYLRRLALLGYNLAMLYSEDTYTLPGEEFFGYLRGRYSAEELKEIDSYAEKLGIEMIGCIQTLGHLSQILKWHAYGKIKDTSSVLLTKEDQTYQLIEKMLGFYSGVFKSRRIHIGMDETHDLGRGRYMDLHGYKNAYEIFTEHLKKVVSICERYELKPMMWSDMFFRMGSKTQNYYDKESKIPDYVRDNIPKNVQLVYWDYYHKDKGFYLEWIKRHQELGSNPVMGSGIWTTCSLWYNRLQTEASVIPCLDACIKMGVDEVFFTMWGDDGAYCDFDSAFAGMTFAGEKIYTGENPKTEILEKRFKSICKGDYSAHIKAAEIVNPFGLDKSPMMDVKILWDDPLLGIFWKNSQLKNPDFWKETLVKYNNIKKQLSRYKKGDDDSISHAILIVDTLSKKIDLKIKLERAYLKHDKRQLQNAKRLIPEMIKSTDKLLSSFRENWHLRNKPFGFEVIQIRLAGQKERFKELDNRIKEYLAGRIDSIPELEEKTTGETYIGCGYDSLATGSTHI
jgi:hexosaminidase